MNNFRETSRTAAEKKLANALRRKKIQFRQNTKILDYEVDFWFPETNLVVEVDGFSHLSIEKRSSDFIKEQRLLENGYVLLRFFNYQIYEQLEFCLAEVERMRKLVVSYKKSTAINDSWKENLAIILKNIDEQQSNRVTRVKKPPAPATKGMEDIEAYFLRQEEETP